MLLLRIFARTTDIPGAEVIIITIITTVVKMKLEEAIGIEISSVSWAAPKQGPQRSVVTSADSAVCSNREESLG